MASPMIREIEVKSVLTKSNLPVSDYSVNTYVGCTHACRYCYASFMKRFTGHPEPWGTFLDVKHWPKIRRPERYAGKELFIGSVTDPYLPQEEVFGRTRALLEQLAGSGVKLSIATKSDLVLRDLDLIKTFPDARVSWSVNTLDEGFKNDMDNAVSIERRLAAMKAFHDAGVRTTCFVSPIFPGITDVKSIIDRVKGQCNLIWLENLNLRGSYKAVILDCIRERYLQFFAPVSGNLSQRKPFLLGAPGSGAEKLCRQDQGFAVQRITVNRPEVIARPAADEFCRRVTGQVFAGIRRRGKFLILCMESGDRLILHLRMTGCLLVTPADYPEEKHTHLVFQLSDGRELRFSDTRRFGRFRSGWPSLSKRTRLCRRNIWPQRDGTTATRRFCRFMDMTASPVRSAGKPSAAA